LVLAKLPFCAACGVQSIVDSLEASTGDIKSNLTDLQGYISTMQTSIGSVSDLSDDAGVSTLSPLPVHCFPSLLMACDLLPHCSHFAAKARRLAGICLVPVKMAHVVCDVM
jgi:hypothetical protein